MARNGSGDLTALLPERKPLSADEIHRKINVILATAFAASIGYSALALGPAIHWAVQVAVFCVAELICVIALAMLAVALFLRGLGQHTWAVVVATLILVWIYYVSVASLGQMPPWEIVMNLRVFLLNIVTLAVYFWIFLRIYKQNRK